MITDYEDYKSIVEDFQQECFNSRKGIYTEHKKIKTCVNLNKLNKIYTGKQWGIQFADEQENYFTYFGQGNYFPKNKEGLAWITDKHTVFFFERPYERTVLNVLQKLLGENRVTTDNNDIMIDGKKVGPSLVTGCERCVGAIIGKKNNGEPIRLEKSDPNTGRIFCLRWDDLEGLNQAFDGIEHHRERLTSKAGLTTLSEYLNISKEEFESLLEK